MSKINKVRDWLLKGHTITPKDAVQMFNYWRLSDGIFQLKNRGYNIVNLNKKGTFGKYKIENYKQ